MKEDNQTTQIAETSATNTEQVASATSTAPTKVSAEDRQKQLLYAARSRGHGSRGSNRRYYDDNY